MDENLSFIRKSKTGIVDRKNYHIIDGKVHMISIFATKS